MPYENLMYSVLEGADLPETNGYRHHSLVLKMQPLPSAAWTLPPSK